MQLPEERVLRVSEVYASVQAEGPRTGMGTIFLRFGGCNLRCPGWPCDTLYAVLPEFREEWVGRSAGHVVGEVLQLCRELNVSNVCLTGGEPFIQQQDGLHYLVRNLLAHDIQVEAFSNGQVRYPDWAFDKVNFIMDWKLAGSGNPAMGGDLQELFLDNIQSLKPTDAIKFVIKNVDDFNEALQYWGEYEPYVKAQWWAGVVWDVDTINEAELLEMIQKEQLPWHLNVQMHKYIWPADKRGV